MNESLIEVAVLDLAGTTVSDPGVVETAVRASVGPRFRDEVFHQYRGGSKVDMLAALVGDDAAPLALESFEAHLADVIAGGAIRPLPRAETVLRDLRECGIRICLSTGFSTAVRTTLLSALGWEGLVDLALSPDEELRGRPFPDLVLAAAIRLQATAMEHVAVVGDTANDVTAARRAGAGIVAAVLTGAHDRVTLRAAGPTHLLDHVGAFGDLVCARARALP